MVKSIHDLSKNDVIRIGHREFTVLDRLDLYQSSMDTENNLQKIEIRLAFKDDPEREGLIINTKSSLTLLDRVNLKPSLIKKNKFRHFGQEYELKERFEVVRSEKDVQFFHNARVYQSRNGVVVAQKLSDQIFIYHGESISRDDIFIVEKGSGVFIPKRNYFNYNEIEKRKVSPLLAGILSVLFLFFGLLYVSPMAAVLGFALIMIPPIVWGVEAFVAAPFICFLVGQILTDMTNKKFYRF